MTLLSVEIYNDAAVRFAETDNTVVIDFSADTTLDMDVLQFELPINYSAAVVVAPARTNAVSTKCSSDVISVFIPAALHLPLTVLSLEIALNGYDFQPAWLFRVAQLSQGIVDVEPRVFRVDLLEVQPLNVYFSYVLARNASCLLQTVLGSPLAMANGTCLDYDSRFGCHTMQCAFNGTVSSFTGAVSLFVTVNDTRQYVFGQELLAVRFNSVSFVQGGNVTVNSTALQILSLVSSSVDVVVDWQPDYPDGSQPFLFSAIRPTVFVGDAPITSLCSLSLSAMQCTIALPARPATTLPLGVAVDRFSVVAPLGSLQVTYLGCPPGSEWSAVLSQCTSCPVGTFSGTVGMLPCQPCPAGQFQDVAASLSCKPCPAGLFRPNPSESVLCSRCPIGQVPSSNQSLCRSCPAGTEPDDSGAVCSLCDNGFYSNIDSNRTCVACLHELSGGGVRSVADRTGCECDAGYALDVSESECITCALGSVCSRAGMTVEQMASAPMYWRSSPTSTDFYRCSKAGCQGGVFADQCAPGYSGVACGVCEEGYSSAGATCLACPSPVIIWFGILLSVAGVLIMIFFLSYRVSAAAGASTAHHDATNQDLAIAPKNSVNKHLVPFVSVFVSHAQMTSILCSFAFSWPSSAALGLGFLSQSTTFSPFAYTSSASCVIRLSYYVRLALSIFSPFFFFFLALMLQVICTRWSFIGRVRFMTHLDWRTMFFVTLLLFYPTVLASSLTPLQCISVGDSSYLSVDMSVECTGQDFETARALAVVALAVFGVGVPVMLVLCGWLLPSTSALGRGSRSLLGSHFRWWFWEATFILRKFSLSICAVTSQISTSSISSEDSLTVSVFVAIPLLLAAITVHIAWKPFLSHLANRFETVSSNITLWSVICGFLVTSLLSSPITNSADGSSTNNGTSSAAARTHSAVPVAITWIVIGANLLFFMWLLLVIIPHAVSWMRGKLLNARANLPPRKRRILWNRTSVWRCNSVCCRLPTKMIR
jgi:hypothetical protein